MDKSKQNLSSPSDSSLDALKSLLLGEEQQQLEQLSERMDDPEIRAEEFAEILPESIRISDQQGSELADALENSIASSIQRSIERNPENFADAIYPVMGPAIRQSIASAMKGLVENINRTLEHSFSIQGIKWRIEAARSGLPFAEIILRHTLAYRVEQVLLIQPNNGLLMQHVSDEQTNLNDADAVSGMLTAIAQFSRDAFQAKKSDGLETIEIGEHTILLTHGPLAYMACAVRGIPPHSLRQQCQTTLENLHKKYASALKAFNGDSDTLTDTQALLQSCLISEHKRNDQPHKKSRKLPIILLIAFAALMWGGYQVWKDWQNNKALHAQQVAYVEALQKQTGVVLTQIEYADTHLTVHGLLDPLATPLKKAQLASGLDQGQISNHVKPYLDLSPEITLKRVKQQTAPPEGVHFNISKTGVVSAKGAAPASWIKKARQLVPIMPGVSAFNSKGLMNYDEQILATARARIKAPQGALLSVKEGHLTIKGHAPLAWINNIPALLDKLPHLEGIETRSLIAEEKINLEKLQHKLNNSFVLFNSGTVISNEQAGKIAQLAREIKTLLSLAKALQQDLTITLIGRTDNTGLVTYNKLLASARALTVQELLMQHGLTESLFQRQDGFESLNDNLPNLNLRRVDFKATLSPHDLP